MWTSLYLWQLTSGKIFYEKFYYYFNFYNYRKYVFCYSISHGNGFMRTPNCAAVYRKCFQHLELVNAVIMSSLDVINYLVITSPGTAHPTVNKYFCPCHAQWHSLVIISIILINSAEKLIFRYVCENGWNIIFYVCKKFYLDPYKFVTNC